jgi:hypothetical protein
MFDVTIDSAIDEFNRLLQEALTNASTQAIKATANDVIKLTLPNNLSNTDKNKPASKQKGTFSKNIKALKQRIKSNILGDNIEGSGIPTAIPSPKGNPLKKTIKGKQYMPFMLVAKPKGSKRRAKVNPTRLKIASSGQELLTHIKNNTKLENNGITFRRRNKGSSIMWITKPSIARQASALLEKRAGNLLSGRSALANRAAQSEGNILSGILGAQTVGKSGSANITIANGKIQFKATNNEVDDKVQSYQQSIVDENIPKTLKYHLENAINHINMNSLRNKAKAKFK